MKRLFTALLSAAVLSVSAADVAEVAKSELSKVAPGTITLKADNSWLYSRNELEHLAKGELAGGKIVAASSSSKRENADPVVALKAFNDDLKALGIRLLVVPVPPKLAVYPTGSLQPGDAMKYLRPFYEELRAQGIDVVDLSDVFIRNQARNVYCRTDAHWSPAGIALAAELLAGKVALKGASAYSVTPTEKTVVGDLARFSDLPESEKVMLDVVSGERFSDSGPVLLLGDSHTLVFSSGGDMLAEDAGLGEQLAVRLGMPVDRIGVKGSAATAVRINLYRKAVKNPDWLKNKKVVIYCFSSREFTEAPSGWAVIPVMKAKQ